MKATINYVERSIYKCFEKFRGQATLKTSDFVKKLDISRIVKERRVIRFQTEAMMRLLLFGELKGIKSQSALMRHLKENPEDRANLGFEQAPDQRSISYFLNQVLDAEDRRFIGFIVNKTEKIAQKFGIVFDKEIMQIKKEKRVRKTSKKTAWNRKREKKREFCKFIRKNIYPLIKFNLRHNSKYKKRTFLDMFLHIATERGFAEGVIEGAYTEWEEGEFKFEPPDADTLLYHLKKYKNIDEVVKFFINIFEFIFAIAKRDGFFDVRKTYNVAIDFTDWHYFGDENDDMVVDVKPVKGTAYGYRFATINILHPGGRFTLLALPMGNFDFKEKVVERLLRYAMGKIRIRKLYVDRGFWDHKIINLFKGLGLTFLMPAVKNARIKRIAEVSPAPMVMGNYEMRGSEFNLAVLDGKKKGEKVLFATNMNVNEREVGLTERLFNLYRRRWGIETSYRVKKQFRPITTSKNYILRLFYFLFSALMYNLWVVINIVIGKSLLGRLPEKPLITAKTFVKLLFAIADYTITEEEA